MPGAATLSFVQLHCRDSRLCRVDRNFPALDRQCVVVISRLRSTHTCPFSHQLHPCLSIFTLNPARTGLLTIQTDEIQHELINDERASTRAETTLLSGAPDNREATEDLARDKWILRRRSGITAISNFLTAIRGNCPIHSHRRSGMENELLGGVNMRGL